MKKTNKRPVHKIGDLLAGLDWERRGRYVKEEFQAYGLQLAEELRDWKHRSLYIRLAKQQPRPLLEKARLFVRDQLPGKVKSKPKLFMWKLAELRRGQKESEGGEKKNS